MADANQEAQELAEILRRVNDELSRYGRLTKDTADDLAAGSTKRAKELRAAGDKTVDALANLGNAAMSAATSLYSGKKGAAAFNSSVDSMGKAAQAASVALMLLVPGGVVVKAFFAAVGLAATALSKYAQAANEMGDKLYTGFDKMQKAGASASDGLTGLFEDAKKLGLSMDELDVMVNAVASNAKGLAGFTGSVVEGRKQLANMGKSLESSRLEFLKLGMQMPEVTEAMAGYMRIQSMSGRINRQTTDEQALAVKKYIYEQDALTKLTGMTRKEQEDAREEVLSQERFAAKVEELRQQGRNAEAEELTKTFLILKSKSKEAAQGFADISTNNLQTEASQKLFRATQGEALKATQRLAAGQITAAQAAQSVAKAAGQTATAYGPVMGQVGTFGDVFGNLSELLRLRGMAEADVTKVLEQIEADRKKTLGKTDPLLDAQARLRETQIRGNEVMERFVFRGVTKATNAMIEMAEAAIKTEEALRKFFGLGEEPGAPGFAGPRVTLPQAEANLTQSVSNREAAEQAALAANDAVAAAKARNASRAELAALEAKREEAEAELAKTIRETQFAEAQRRHARRLARQQQPVPDTRTPLPFSNPFSSGAEAPQERAMGSKDATGQWFENFGSGRLMILHNDEAVVPYEQRFEFVRDILSMISGNQSSATGATPAAGAAMKPGGLTDVQTKIFDTLQQQMRLFNQDTDEIKKFSVIAMNYHRQVGEFMKRVTSDIQTTNYAEKFRQLLGIPPEAAAPPAAAQPTPAAAAPAAVSATPQAMAINSQDDLKRLGLRIKPGDVQADAAKISPKLIELAQTIQSVVPGFRNFTAFNDRFHQEKAPGSQHAQGLAVDFVLNQQPSREDGQTIVDWLKKMGATLAIDEYNNPSAQSTAGHFHAQIPAFGEGRIMDQGPTLAMVGERGPEAVIPLSEFEGMVKNLSLGNIVESVMSAQKPTPPVDNSGFNDLLNVLSATHEQNTSLLNTVQQLLSAQRDQNDISKKILTISQ